MRITSIRTSREIDILKSNFFTLSQLLSPIHARLVASLERVTASRTSEPAIAGGSEKPMISAASNSAVNRFVARASRCRLLKNTRRVPASKYCKLRIVGDSAKPG